MTTGADQSQAEGQRAWMLLAVSEPQYRGNDGYEDETERVYRYDNNVSNHLRLSEGHFVVVRRDHDIAGAAVVGKIAKSKSKKAINLCPECGSSSVKARRKVVPPFRCSGCRAEFAVPVRRETQVTTYEAWLSGFIRPSRPLTDEIFRPTWLQLNDQFSIRALSASKIDDVLKEFWPEAQETLRLSACSGGIDARDSDEDSPSNGGYVPTAADQRALVMRQIRARRGQKKFREALLRAYEKKCVFSGCALVDLLEAAHILPYRGASDHHPSNGLLLRADLHTLFDLNLIAVDPESQVLRVSGMLKGFGYDHLHELRLDPKVVRKLSKAALQIRWAAFIATPNSAAAGG